MKQLFYPEVLDTLANFVGVAEASAKRALAAEASAKRDLVEITKYDIERQVAEDRAKRALVEKRALAEITKAEDRAKFNVTRKVTEKAMAEKIQAQTIPFESETSAMVKRYIQQCELNAQQMRQIYASNKAQN